jgi:hypothetical protein
VKAALQLGGLQFMIYFLGCVSIRSAADANYLWTGCTDALILLFTFWAVKKLVEAKHTLLNNALFVIGGTIGSQAAIFLTVQIWRH